MICFFVGNNWISKISEVGFSVATFQMEQWNETAITSSIGHRLNTSISKSYRILFNGITLATRKLYVILLAAGILKPSLSGAFPPICIFYVAIALINSANTMYGQGDLIKNNSQCFCAIIMKIKYKLYAFSILTRSLG